jgi:hypothetical protein
MTNHVPVRSLALLGGAMLLGACGGGGAGAPGSTSASFTLSDASYGRQINDGTTVRLVSPLTTAVIDPFTGFLKAGSLQPIAGGVDVDAKQTLGLGSDFLPRVIPRNAVIELKFSAPVDPTSVTADVIDANGALVTAGSIQVRFADDTPVPVELTQISPSVIWLDPVVVGTAGFPASPVDFGPSGEPRADATGFLKLRLPRSGSAILRSTKGAFLGKRADSLGDLSRPIGINPGNRVLDFIQQNQLIPTNETYNGFLPDNSTPRIAREHRFEHAFDSLAGDAAGATDVTIFGTTFATLANGGAGEWAAASLVLRPGLATEESLAIVSNTDNVLTLATPFVQAPTDGDILRLVRSELFEPDLANPIDPATFDPNNPENANNASFANFVEAFEIDSSLNVVRGPISLRDAVPTFSELRVRFTEPIADDSVLNWETFRVAAVPDGGETQELLTAATLDGTAQVVIIRPLRHDQAAGTFELVGWGKGTKNLQLIVKTVPRASFLRQSLGTAAYEAFLDEGVRGLVDLGGQPIAFPTSLFDPANPAILFSAPFTSTELAVTQPNPPVAQSWGVVVHRMRGRPVTGIDPTTGLAGVAYKDQVNYYYPIPDVNLQTNGLLAGSPVVEITKIHDQYFPPEGQFSVLFNGLPAPLTSNTTAQGQAHDGARFHAVWRDFDCSPNSLALAGTLLDLYRVSWCPIGGNVTTDTYDDISIHCAHSPIRPISSNNTGGASYPQSGLSNTFSYETFIDLIDGGSGPCVGISCSTEDGPNYWDTLVTVVQPGTRYSVSQNALFTPSGDLNAWHPWPTFSVPFQYNNGDKPQAETDLRNLVNSTYNCGGTEWEEYRTTGQGNLGGDSLLFEVRVRPQTTTVSGQNGFSYVIGCLIDFFGQPSWRAYSCGGGGTTINPDDINGDANARCAVGHLDSTAARGSDSSRYLGVFDYVKTTSKITSPWVRIFPSNTVSPDYFPVILDPPISAQPLGTSVLMEFEGATSSKGVGATGFSTSVNIADTKSNIAFRVTLVGNTSTLLLPNFDTIAIPFLRPQGS